MNDEQARHLLAATCELWLLKNRESFAFQPSATGDVVSRMLERGVLARSPDGRLISRAGGSPEDVLQMVRADAPHLFRGPDDAAPALAPKPDPRGLSPTARLALANGDDNRVKL